MPTLKDIREQYYISRRHLADLAGVSESTIVRMEDPQHKTTYEKAEKVLAALSKKVGRTFTVDSVEGLNLYNVMRDRKQRGRESGRSREGEAA